MGTGQRTEMNQGEEEDRASLAARADRARRISSCRCAFKAFSSVSAYFTSAISSFRWSWSWKRATTVIALEDAVVLEQGGD